jgi:hypothetical protein
MEAALSIFDLDPIPSSLVLSDKVCRLIYARVLTA